VDFWGLVCLLFRQSLNMPVVVGRVIFLLRREEFKLLECESQVVAEMIKQVIG